MALFESYERRIDKINEVLNSYGIASLEEAEKITKDAGPGRVRPDQGHPARSVLRTPAGLISQARLSRSRKAAEDAADAAGCHRRGPSGFLHPGICCGSAESWPGPR